MNRGSDGVDERTSLRMKRVRQRDTAPEMAVRKLLFAGGYRYRIHRRDLPGSPDVVFPRWRKVIFVHGCFWHGHPGCARASLPRNRAEYWRSRIATNRERDRRSEAALRKMGWFVCIVWECEVARVEALRERLAHFLRDRGPHDGDAPARRGGVSK